MTKIPPTNPGSDEDSWFDNGTEPSIDDKLSTDAALSPDAATDAERIGKTVRRNRPARRNTGHRSRQAAISPVGPPGGPPGRPPGETTATGASDSCGDEPDAEAINALLAEAHALIESIDAEPGGKTDPDRQMVDAYVWYIENRARVPLHVSKRVSLTQAFTNLKQVLATWHMVRAEQAEYGRRLGEGEPRPAFSPREHHWQKLIDLASVCEMSRDD
ncbi:hypothetical protein LJR230_002170 [Trinickia sp. LjRoot230]|uniref:hypothetical protein n=1 Tax=Trinickia sp. LjRoot230 TaxID=3342288 RepID=UPI003ECD9414